MSAVNLRSRAPANLLSKLESRGVNVGNAERIASAAGGASLLAWGIAKRGVTGSIFGLLGGALLYRGATGHCDVYEALGRSTAGPDPGLATRHSVSVNAPPEELYRFWRPLDTLPRFMKHLRSVTRTGPLESHWVAQSPGGRTLEWDARIVAEEEGRFLAWESMPGSDVAHNGSVRFRPAPGGRGTIVEVEMRVQPFGSGLAAAFATIFGKGAEAQIREDLRRFKQWIEAGEIPTTDGQPSGRGRGRDPGYASPEPLDGGEREPGSRMKSVRPPARATAEEGGAR